MAFVDQFLDGDDAQVNGPVASERESLCHRLVPLFRARRFNVMLLAPCAHALDDQLVNGLKVAALDLGLNQSFQA
jgi:hypothetical protein